MIYKNVCGWFNPPVLQAGDIIDGGNLYTMILPNIDITIKNVNLLDVDIPPLVTVIDCITGKSQPPEPIEPVQNLEVASKAELVFRSLISSGKLPEAMITVVEQMLIMVKSKVNVTDIELGLVATIQTQEIIDSFRQIGDSETVQQLEQALSAVQAMWRVE